LAIAFSKTLPNSKIYYFTHDEIKYACLFLKSYLLGLKNTYNPKAQKNMINKGIIQQIIPLILKYLSGFWFEK